MNASSTSLEKESLEAHVDLCALRYETLEKRFEQVDERIDRLEEKLDAIADEVRSGNASMTKVLIGATGTIVTGLLSTIVVLLMQ